MPNAATTQASSASDLPGAPIPLAYGYVWATGKRAAYYMMENTGESRRDFTRVGIWLLGHGEWDGVSELWINDELVLRGMQPTAPPQGFTGQQWVAALDGGEPLVFNFHSGTDAVIGSGFVAGSQGPDQGLDILWPQFPAAINPLHYSRIAYYAIMRKQQIQNQTNTHQQDPTQWTDINPIGLWRALRCRLFDANGNVTGYAFTTNPAWHFVDVLLRRKLFVEYNIDLTAGPDSLPAPVRSRFNWAAIYASAQYCDEILANGRRRFEGNYFFASSTSLQAVLTQIMMVCRGYMTEDAGQIALNIDQPRAAVFTFNRNHVLPGSLEASDQIVHVAPNRVVAKFRDILVPAINATIVSITSTVGGRPVVTMSAPHPFNAQDWIAIGGTDTVYDGEWQVYSVPAVLNSGTPSEVDPTTFVMNSKGSNYPAAIGAGGYCGLLYARFSGRSPEFWHKANMMARGAVGIGIPRLRNRVKQTLEFANSTYDQASRISRYERDRRLGLDATPYVTPPFVKLRTSMFAVDAAGNMAAAIQPGDHVVLDNTVSQNLAGDYEVLDGLRFVPPGTQPGSSGASIVLEVAPESGEIELALGPYNTALFYDSSDPTQAGWPSVPGSDPGGETGFFPIDLANGGNFVFFTGLQPSGSQFQLPSSGYPAANLLAWTGPAGANVNYHSMRVIELCQSDASRNLSLIYTDDIGNFWGGDVTFAALSWLSSDMTTTSNGMTWLELTLLGGETILFGFGVFADGSTIVLPAGYSAAQCFAVAYPHDTPTTATHNPRMYGANVDSSLGVHFTYSDFNGNLWHGNAQVLVFAWKNNMGTVVKTAIGTATWIEIALTNGKKFGVGLAPAVPDGTTLTLPPDAAIAQLSSICGSTSWATISGAGHTWGIVESYLDSGNVVHCRFGSASGTWPGIADVFMLYVSAGVAAPVLVNVSPASVSMAAAATQQFSAVVGNNANQSVVWSVDGIVGGNLSVGTIDASGFYAAPTQSGSHTVTAASVADPAATGSAAVTIFSDSLTGNILTDDAGDVIYTDTGDTISA
ncbi:MAG: hypothetical protein KGL64_04575 [Acidobacteriota bacterium]|nr:hypothetical protein [Acidobacteriota bacterium]